MHVDGTDIRIDKFTRGAGVYFLSHFHSDHMSGLREGWNRGPLYCSTVTEKLLRERYGIDGDVVHTVVAGESVRVASGAGEYTVRAIDANHCPGAVMFCFEWPDRRILYTGDFRLDDNIRREVAELGDVDLAYMDTTYDDPKYEFPSQEESIEEVIRLVGEHMDKEIFLAVYNIGKTKILQAVKDEYDLPVCVSEKIVKLYRAMGFEHLVTCDASMTNLRGHGRWYFGNRFPWRHRRYRSTHAVIIPTGWAVDGGGADNGYMYVPYSEHCDYRELCEFRELLQPAEAMEI